MSLAAKLGFSICWSCARQRCEDVRGTYGRRHRTHIFPVHSLTRGELSICVYRSGHICRLCSASRRTRLGLHSVMLEMAVPSYTTISHELHGETGKLSDFRCLRYGPVCPPECDVDRISGQRAAWRVHGSPIYYRLIYHWCFLSAGVRNQS